MRKTEKGEPIEALALDYNPLGKKAPRVVAKGKGFVAKRIIELARKTGVPIDDMLQMANNLRR
jgi:flagellar biosynthesis protein